LSTKFPFGLLLDFLGSVLPPHTGLNSIGLPPIVLPHFEFVGSLASFTTPLPLNFASRSCLTKALFVGCCETQIDPDR